MKLRAKRQRYWWTYHVDLVVRGYNYRFWGMARIKHQRKSK